MNKEMKTDFRPAYIKDFEACWNIIDQARRSMIASGRHQWTSDYPAEHDIKEDINNGNAYVLTVDGEVAVYGAVILNGEPQYDFIDGDWLTTGDYYVIHRFATLPKYQREGLARIFINGLLSKMGFSICGRINYGNRGMRFAFEKLTIQPQIY